MPTKIENLSQLQEMLAIIMDASSQKQVKVSAEMKWMNQQNNKMESKVVSGVSKDSSLFGLLVDGMDVVKKRYESIVRIGEAIKKAKETDESLSVNMTTWDINKVKFNVDNLIEKKLGGKRNGLRIKWKVTEGIYEFDPYVRKLFKVEEEHESLNKDGNTDKIE